MSRPAKNKSALHCTTCAAALTLGALIPSHAAQAQAFQATPTIVQGTVNIDRSVSGLDTITVGSNDAVVDWLPDIDNSGSAATYLPDGNTAIFQGELGQPGFGIVNRILPSLNGDMVVIDGTVISQLRDANGGPSPGGFVMFYSSTGIIVGPNAAFDVGGLMLTTLAPDINNLPQFLDGSGQLDLAGTANDTSSITISAGAAINGTQEGSFLAVTAPQITMDGTADINGSTAYVAAENMALSYANGLFDIIIFDGTNVSNALSHGGTTTGPASTGAGDNHVIYGVMQGQQSPINAFFSGNLGFQPAASATVENGVIILSANYAVNGAAVQNDFTYAAPGTNVPAQITVQNANISSSIAVHSSDAAQIVADNGTTQIEGDAFIYARSDARLTASGDALLTISGNAEVSADDGANVTSDGSDFFDIDAFAGSATAGADQGGSFQIGGDLSVHANGFAGYDVDSLNAGAATGGQASLFADSGFVTVGGLATLGANAIGASFPGLTTGGNLQGGSISISTANDSFVDLQGGLSASASAAGHLLTVPGDGSPAGDAAGGDVLLDNNASILNIGGNLDFAADAAGSASPGGAAGGGSGNGGFAQLSGQNGAVLTVAGDTSLTATGTGGSSAGTLSGGGGTGGTTEVLLLDTAAADFGAQLLLDSSAEGGQGGTGGDGFGGTARLSIIGGTATVTGDTYLSATGTGGAGNDGTGDSDGFASAGGFGIGGGSEIQVGPGDGTPASLIISGTAYLDTSGFGGDGGDGDGAFFGGGNGGDGFGGLFDPFDMVGGSGAYSYSEGATLVLGGLEALANGYGGEGGSGLNAQPGGNGGYGEGGSAGFGVLQAVGSQLPVSGSADFGAFVQADAVGQGGNGGLGSISGTPANGNGGDGAGGDAIMFVTLSSAAAGDVGLDAVGSGGFGAVGGFGAGGNAIAIATDGGTANIGTIFNDATGQGGGGTGGNGGDGTGGVAGTEVSAGAAVNIAGNQRYFAPGEAGTSSGGNGGNGLGGTAYILADSGTLNAAASDVILNASSYGGTAFSAGFLAGTGSGGGASIEASDTGLIDLGTVYMEAGAEGGRGDASDGGDAIGGNVSILAIGAEINIADELEIDNYAVGGDSLGGPTGLGGAGLGGTVSFSAFGDANGVAGIINLPAAPPPLASGHSIVVQSQGGASAVDGGTGGEAQAGFLSIDAGANGTITGGPLILSNSVTGGSSANGALDISGGNAGVLQGGLSISATGGGNLSFQALATSSAFGGDGSGAGNGGDAVSADTFLSIGQDSSADLLANSALFSFATGGFGQNGGSGTSGDAGVNIGASGSLLVDPAGQLTVRTVAAGGDADGTGGDGIGSTSSVIIDGGSLGGGSLVIDANANAGSGTAGGAATGGTAQLLLRNQGTATLAALSMDTAALAFGSGAVQGGTVQVVADGAGSSLDAAATAIDASASGGTTNLAGLFQIDAINGGSIVMDSLAAAATNPLGTQQGGQSRLQALAGNIQINDSAAIMLDGDLLVQTGQNGSVLGGTALASLTAAFDFNAGGTITVTGDDGALAGFGAQLLRLSSRDIDIGAGALTSSSALELYSLNLADAAIIGGSTDGAAYTLTQVEASRIDTASLLISGAGGTGSTSYDLVLRDLGLAGSQTSALGDITIVSGGTLGILGPVSLNSAAAGDQLTISAAQALSVNLDTGGGVMVTAADGSLSGLLEISAPRIFAADTATLSLLESDPSDTANYAALIDDGGNASILNYIGADTVSLFGDDYLLMQNTGAQDTLAGIIVGPGGLTIQQFSGALSPTMMTIAYGMQDAGAGGQVINEDFFAQVNFGADVVNGFTAEATFNDCVIVTGLCGSAPPPPPPPPPEEEEEIEIPVTTKVYTQIPPTTTSVEAAEQARLQANFGMEFPAMINSPQVNERGLVDDPVTSGGDSVSYQASGNAGEED